MLRNKRTIAVLLTATMMISANTHVWSSDEDIRADIISKPDFEADFQGINFMSEPPLMHADDNDSNLQGKLPSDGGWGGGFGGSSEVTQGSAANEITEDGSYSGITYTSTGDDENALRVTGATVTLDNISVEKTGGSSSNTENGDFYGVDAALLATDGANVTVTGSTVTSSAQNGNGIFSYGSSTIVNIYDTVINTSADNSGGIQTTGGGTTNAYNLTVNTEGSSSAAIRSDRGGGTVNVDGGSYISNGYNSPAVYSTAEITVKNAELTANNSEALVIEGENSITLENCNVSGNMSDTQGTSSDENVHNVMIYQSMSGDAETGTSQFKMTDGTLTSNNGDMFYITNTACILYLSNVNIVNNETACYLLNITGNSGGHGWGSAGSNGSQTEFTADNQILDGDIRVDTISTLDMSLTNNSVFTGTVNIEENEQGGTTVSNNAVITIDENSVWNLTGNCVITSLTNNGTVNFNGYTITLADGTVLSDSSSLDNDTTEAITVTTTETVTEITTAATTETTTKISVGDESSIVLSDNGIYVNGILLGSSTINGIYTANDIICVRDDYSNGYYYTSGGDDALSEDEIHSEEEAAANTVVHITNTGTYRISGTLSAGQIAVELEDVSSDECSVELILDNANISCTVAPAVIFYSVYEPYDGTSAEQATTAGAVVTIADNSVNTINGSHVGKTFKDTTYSKKQYKFDGAFYSKQTMIVQSEGSDESEWGTLNINGDNEGLDSELHLTINGGNINIVSKDDGINVNEDYIITFTMNGGYVHISAGVDGSEGDGIDSNGDLYINGGTLISYAHNVSDGGLDADGTILINGGVVAAFGGRNDSVDQSSAQEFMQLTYKTSNSLSITIMTKDSEKPVFVIAPEREYTDVIISSPVLSYGTTYYVLSGGTIDGEFTKGVIYNTDNITVAGGIQQCYAVGGTSTGGDNNAPGFGVGMNNAPSFGDGMNNNNSSETLYSNDFTPTASSNVFTGITESSAKTFTGDVINKSVTTESTVAETSTEITTEAVTDLTETVTEKATETTSTETTTVITSTETATETTTVSTVSETSSETTTVKKSSSGGGSGSGSSKTTTTTTTTETTTEVTTLAADDNNSDIDDEDNIESWNNPFKDIDEDSEFYEAVRFVTDKGIFKGVELNKFDPDAPLTRAMLVAVLWRMEGMPESGTESKFSDVNKDAYYSEAVVWAENNNIVKGISNTEFAPDRLITKEEISAIIKRYAENKNYIIETNDNLNIVAENVSFWAEDDVKWIIKTEIPPIGNSNKINMTESVTRAEAAYIIMNLAEK